MKTWKLNLLAGSLTGLSLLAGGVALAQQQSNLNQEEIAELTRPIYLTTMTHMEENHTDDVDQLVFERRCEVLRYGIALFDEYGAKMTVESELPFSRACGIWGENMLLEVVNAGHGVGTHCDVGFTEPEMPVSAFALELKERKDAVDALVGAANNRHFSGGGGVNDYVQAGNIAGFEFMDGIVSMHYLSMPLRNRPLGYTDDYICNGHSHEHAPARLGDRLHLQTQNDALDFAEDLPASSLSLVLSNGELGPVSGMAEHAAGESGPNNTFDDLDADATVQQIKYAARVKVSGEVAKLNLYVSLSDLNSRNEDAFRALFTALNKLERKGIIKYATQGEVYDVYRQINP